MSCPICKGEAIHPITKVEAAGAPRMILMCEKCDHQFVSNGKALDYSQAGMNYFYKNWGSHGITSPELTPEWLDVITARMQTLKEHGLLSKFCSKLIEIGCLEGALLEYLESFGHTVIGYEPNLVMSDLRDFVIPAKFETILDSVQGCATGIFAFETMHQIEDPVAVVTQAYRVLEPGGHFLMSAKVACYDYTNPETLHWFTEKSATALFAHFKDRIVKPGYGSIVISGTKE